MRRTFDLSAVVLIATIAGSIALFAQAVKAIPDAGRGLVIYETHRTDAYIDAALIDRAETVRVSRSLIRKLDGETVMVATRAGTHAIVGTGVVIVRRGGNATILTAKHVVAHAGIHVVVFPSRRWRVASHVSVASNRDLALVRVRIPAGERIVSATFAHGPLPTGAAFVVVGHPGAHAWFASTGVAEQHLFGTLLFCPHCGRGDSGAGAFSTDGRLRGIVVLQALIDAPMRATGRFVNVRAFEIEPLSHIRAFVERAGV